MKNVIFNVMEKSAVVVYRKADSLHRRGRFLVGGAGAFRETPSDGYYK
jgi:hypothetical protein